MADDAAHTRSRSTSRARLRAWRRARSAPASRPRRSRSCSLLHQRSRPRRRATGPPDAPPSSPRPRSSSRRVLARVRARELAWRLQLGRINASSGKKKCAHVSDASALHACCSRARVLARMSAGVLACSLAGLLACSRRLTPPAGSPFCSFASASAAAVAARVRPPLQRRVRVHQRARCVHLIAVAADVSALLRRALTKPAFSFPRPTSRRRQGAHRR